MKRLSITVLIVIAICAVAIVTCPDRQAHKDAIMSVLNEKINESLTPSGADEEGLSLLIGSLGSSVVGRIVDNRLTVSNHFLWSTGEIKNLKGENDKVSIGIFGHVFTFSKEDLDRQLEDLWID